MYEKYRIRRYGFHGTSHQFVAERCAELLEKPLAETKIITVHIGNGGSLAAVKGGQSVDTTMGFTPLAGIMMGTRSGDIDPAILPFIMEKENLDTKQANDLVNKKSGVLGISGISSDMRDLENAAMQGNERAKLALDVYAYKVKKYIGSYIAAMNGLDLLIFTGGIGENSMYIREQITSNMEYLGIKIDKNINDSTKGVDAIISTEDSKVCTIVATTNEELVIARDTMRIVDNLK